MWPKTSLTELLNIQYPIVQAPMAGVTTPELVSAVSNAGGLGSYGAAYTSPDELPGIVRAIKNLTNKPFAVNLFIPNKCTVNDAQVSKVNALLQPFRDELSIPKPESLSSYEMDFDAQLKVIVDEKVPVFSFTFGAIEKSDVKLLKRAGIKVIGKATSPEEALLLQKRGVDAIVAQGSEAGGHRATFLKKDGSTLSAVELLPKLIKQLDVPVIAAGGFVSAEDIYAALQLRASAVEMGTVFLMCPESSAHPLHKAAILNMHEDKTVLTKAFSGRRARAIRNRFADELSQCDKILLDYPAQNAYTADIRKAAAKQDRAEFMALWAGSLAYSINEAVPAVDLMTKLVTEVKQIV